MGNGHNRGPVATALRALGYSNEELCNCEEALAGCKHGCSTAQIHAKELIATAFLKTQEVLERYHDGEELLAVVLQHKGNCIGRMLAEERALAASRLIDDIRALARKDSGA